MIIGNEQELLDVMDRVVKKQLCLLKPVAECWQPSEILPDLTREDWREQIDTLRKNASGLSDETLVVLAGNLVTEEALPSYQTWLNRAEGLTDETGASDSAWGKWSRGWTSEENRHGDLIHAYLYLSGRANMRSVQVTTQHLITNGFDMKSDTDPFKSIVYASFQERATKISHANTGKLAEKGGDPLLTKICTLIAADEARHEEAYKRFFAGVLEYDTERGILAFADMMRTKIAMPARLMADGTGRDLFENFAIVAQRSGVYTTRDYAEVTQHLVDFWKIGSITRLSPEAAEAQEYLCGLSAKYLAKADRIQSVVDQAPHEPFSWIFDRTV